MYVVDTNILVYSANRNSPEHNRCRDFVEHVHRDSNLWFLTWGIIYEFLRVVTHHRVMTQPWDVTNAWRFILVLLASPGLEILRETDRHVKTAKDVFNSTPGLHGNVLFDFHTAVLMKENGIQKIYTRDTHFHKFAFLEVIDPLTFKS